MQRVPLGMRFGQFPAPSLPHGHRQMSPLTSAGMSQPPPQLSAAGYSADFTGFDQQQAFGGLLSERHVKLRRVGNGQPLRRSSAYQHNMVGILPQHHHQDSAQPYWHAEQANAAATPLQPVHGYSPTYTAPSINHYSHANAPTQKPIHPVPIPATHPHWTSGGGHQGQGQIDYNSGPADYAQMRAYQSYTSPPLATLSQATLSLVNEPSPHVSPYLEQGNPTATNETPNSGVGPSGCDIDISGASTSGEPTPPIQRTRTNHGDRSSSGHVPRLSRRPAHPVARKTQPVGYEGDLVLLQQRCRKQGADEGAIELLAKVCVGGVSLEALTRPLTNSAVETVEFGVSTGKVYTAFLAPTKEEEGVAPRYVCRLCHSDQAWMHSKDVLRHLRRDHFGLAHVCKKWYVSIVDIY